MIPRRGWMFLSFALIVALSVGCCPSFSSASPSSSSSLPLVINTWPFTAATDAAWTTLVAQADADTDTDADIQSKPGTAQRALDALVSGCTACEQLQCDGTVGYGGSPDETGETTLDAMIMNGDTFEVGAVVDLRNVKNAIGVARAVMDYTSHTILAGSAATNFALEMGFRFESLETNVSAQMHADWKAANCQPNYRRNVLPDATTSCGPYKPIPPSHTLFRSHHTSHDVTTKTHRPEMSENNHDTISMLVIGTGGSVHAATSTNGARNKIAGRVGDSPVVGAGAYAESGIGACGATGDGDVMMRFLPSFAGVEAMRAGTPPQQAAINILTRILNKYPSFQGAIICADISGGHGGAAHNWLKAPFSYSIRSPDTNTTQVIVVPNININNNNNHHHNKHKHHTP